MSIDKKVRYKQPYSIKVIKSNEAMEYHLRMKLHGYYKHQSKYLRSKRNRRLYFKG